MIDVERFSLAKTVMFQHMDPFKMVRHYRFIVVYVMSDVYVGLRNDRGMNNCFLNSVVQGIYHCPLFRIGVFDVDLDACVDFPVVHALLVLLRELEDVSKEGGVRDANG